ncbi:packaged DNA stabilization protein [Arsukibacterium sp.]|uniref:packaged DNA stabilization protein n=1 Tax=Arsukibacterium sp. TaxID=1977258 RepID=UPI002FD91805
MKQQIQWVVSSNSGRSKAANSSRLINAFAEALPQDSKSPVVLYGTPGLGLFSQLPTGPVLALHEFKNKLYAVTETNLYRVEADGQYADVGEVDLSGKVIADDNGIQLVIVDGKKGYFFDGEEVTELSGDGWYPANTVTYQDGYFIFNRTGTGQFFISGLLSVELDALDFATAEGSPDNTLAVISNGRELWVLGEDSIEVWYNSGAALFPFDRLQGAFIETGLLNSYAVSKLDSSLFFVGDDRIVYRTNGYNPIRISTHAVEHSIAQGDISDAYSWEYKYEGHAFYLITFPKLELTWCFDVSTGLWHERASINFGHHIASCHCDCYGRQLVGDFQSGAVFDLSMDAQDDNGDPIIRTMQAPVIHGGRGRMFCHELELDMESGVGLVTGYGSTPMAMLQWSDDGGKTWSNEQWTAIGKLGEYLTRVRWRRLGSFRQRIFKVVITDPVPMVVMSAFIEVERGSN